MNPRLFTFIGGNTGPWTVIHFKTVTGSPILEPKKLEIVNGPVAALPVGAQWLLKGVTSNVRYLERDEKVQLDSKQPALGRPEATHGALIPIRKNAKWWNLTQNERRAIFEDRSHHTATGLKYLPSIARRLHHCRDLETCEPFDFLTFFDYAKADSTAFEDLVAALRATEEWKFVDREIDIRLIRS
jgi:chlorite dismutase